MVKIKFRMEMQRVLEVLSKEIYDSPYALLRENVQNAYDAILMRAGLSGGAWTAEDNGIIRVSIDNEKLIVSDNGIGMSEAVVRENYWRAGASGKNTELAAKSGVVGRFGIGGMANFGVCSKLKVETESIETHERIVSKVERQKLSLTEDCIELEKVSPTGEYGTIVEATLDPESKMVLGEAKNYLALYIQYLPVKVEFNGSLISQRPMSEQYRDDSAKLQKEMKNYELMGAKSDALVQCNETGRVSCSLSNIYLSGQAVSGKVYLRQDSGTLWGLRSSFGLSPIPIGSYYSFGGLVDISVLSPTAGRDALTRESIELSSMLLRLADDCSTNVLASSEICNRSNPFMSHILATGRVNLAEKLLIKALPDQEMTLGELKEQSKQHKCYYYDGNDESIIKAYATPDTPLIILSKSNPRRQLESQFIQRYCTMEKVADVPRVIKEYDEKRYEISEVSFIIRAKNILEEDYAIDSVNIRFAELSHRLPYIIRSPAQGPVEIFLQRNHPTLQPIMNCYSEAYDVFPGFIRDFIRVHIYPQVRNRVPSSTREGAEALQKTLRQKRELYEINAEDVALTSLFSDLVAGKIDLQKVISTANTFRKSQTQEITKVNIGSMESEIPDLVEEIIQAPKNTEYAASNQNYELQPAPPIIRTELDTNKKLLFAEKKISALNDFQTFLAISDRAFSEEYDFFLNPHTTRIIWGGRRIISIFTHASERFSLYYDVEILEDTGRLTGGGIFPTTTIITKHRIFIPVPDPLRKFFEIAEGKRKFYVRFDTISSSE